MIWSVSGVTQRSWTSPTCAPEHQKKTNRGDDRAAPQSTYDFLIFQREVNAMKYDFQAIEKKWQARWEEEKPLSLIHI